MEDRELFILVLRYLRRLDEQIGRIRYGVDLLVSELAARSAPKPKKGRQKL